MPSVSPLRHLPSLPTIYTPLDIRRSDTITPTENDNDIIPRPLFIKKVKQSLMPFRKSGRGGREGKEKDGESKRGFLGMNFSQSSKVVVLRYWVRIGIKVNLMGADISIMLGTSSAEKGQDLAIMERGCPGYNGLLQDRR